MSKTLMDRWEEIKDLTMHPLCDQEQVDATRRIFYFGVAAVIQAIIDDGLDGLTDVRAEFDKFVRDMWSGKT